MEWDIHQLRQPPCYHQCLHRSKREFRYRDGQHAVESTVGTTQSNNIITTAYTSHFVNYTGFNMHLKAGSTAINAGASTNAPTIDLEKKTRTAPYDVGCYEYGDVPTGVGDSLHEEDHAIRLYPNPVTGSTFYIETGKVSAQPASIRIMDLHGKVVYTKLVQRFNQQVVPVTCRLPGGAYIVEMISGMTTRNRKIIVK